MDETVEPLLEKNNNENNENPFPRTERKSRGKLSETLFPKSKSFALNIKELKEKDARQKKIENKFIFKVYLHFFTHTIFILLMTILAFKCKIFHTFLWNNLILFFIILIITFSILIYPLFNDQILKTSPYNYFYFIIFTICISYIICKIFIYFNPNLVQVGIVLFIFELIYLIVDAYISKRKNLEIGSTTAFMGLCLLFIGSILYFIEKVNFFKLIFIILFILLFGIYLIYDTNLIFLEARRKFKEDEYILATIFLYIDLIQTIVELISKFYNSYEPEKKPIQKNTGAKSMIYVGDEDYVNKYNKKEEDEKEKDDKIVVIKRTNSVKGFKLDPNKIIKEENENEESEVDNENNRSFKRHYSGAKIMFENKDEEENNNENRK